MRGRRRLPPGGDRGREEHGFAPEVRGWGGDRGRGAGLRPSIDLFAQAPQQPQRDARRAAPPVARRVRLVREALVQRESVRAAGIGHEGDDEGVQVREPLRLSGRRHHGRDREAARREDREHPARCRLRRDPRRGRHDVHRGRQEGHRRRAVVLAGLPARRRASRPRRSRCRSPPTTARTSRRSSRRPSSTIATSGSSISATRTIRPGASSRRARCEQLLDGIPEDVPVLIDEAYHHFVDNGDYATSVPYVLEGRPVIVTRTFSKIAALAGMRLGYARRAEGAHPEDAPVQHGEHQRDREVGRRRRARRTRRARRR